MNYLQKQNLVRPAILSGSNTSEVVNLLNANVEQPVNQPKVDTTMNIKPKGAPTQAKKSK